MLLARLPQLLPNTKKQRCVLEEKDRVKPPARPTGKRFVEAHGLDGNSDLGMQAKKRTDA